MAIYNEQWDESFPTDAQQGASLDDYIRELKRAITERMQTLVDGWPNVNPLKLKAGSLTDLSAFAPTLKLVKAFEGSVNTNVVAIASQSSQDYLFNMPAEYYPAQPDDAVILKTLAPITNHQLIFHVGMSMSFPNWSPVLRVANPTAASINLVAQEYRCLVLRKATV